MVLHTAVSTKSNSATDGDFLWPKKLEPCGKKRLSTYTNALASQIIFVMRADTDHVMTVPANSHVIMFWSAVEDIDGEGRVENGVSIGLVLSVLKVHGLTELVDKTM